MSAFGDIMRRDALSLAGGGFGEDVVVLAPAADPVTVRAVVHRLGRIENTETGNTYEAAEVFLPRDTLFAVPAEGWRMQLAMRDGGAVVTARVCLLLSQDSAGVTVEVRA